MTFKPHEKDLLDLIRKLDKDQAELITNLLCYFVQPTGRSRASTPREQAPRAVVSPPRPVIEERSDDRPIHALLKLGTIVTESGKVIRASDTIECLKRMVQEGSASPIYLGTNSQAVSDRFKKLIGRLYLLAPAEGKEQTVQMVLDVDEVLDQWEFYLRQQHENPRVCPEGMEQARTWFRIRKVFVPKGSCTPDHIKLLKTGESIRPAVTSGRATFFYVRPIEGLQLSPFPA